MSTDGLRDYLDRKAAAMRAAAQRRPRGDDWHETVEATCVADDSTGARKLTIGDWHMLSDSGPDFGGQGAGPTSPELLCGVVSTCLTHTYLIGAAWLGIPVDRVEVRVTAENNDARFVDVATEDPPLPFNITARVTLRAGDATPDQRATLHQYARERCPLTALIRQPNELRIEVDET